MDINKTRMTCSIKSCKSRTSSKSISFFGYPKDERLAIWIKNCETEHLAEILKKTTSYKICGEHFEDKMFLNATTKSRLVFNAISTKFSDDILFQRKQLKEMSSQQPETQADHQDFSLPICSNPALDTEELPSVSMMSDISSVSNTLMQSSDSSNQAPSYLSANTPRKKKMAQEMKDERINEKTNI